MRRREFISLVGTMTAALPLVTRAHQAGMNRSGLLMSVAQSDLEETFSDGYRKSINISRKTTGTCSLTPEEFDTAYPKLRGWIQQTLEFYEKNAKPVASMHFVRLPLYFDPSLLETAKFIAIDRLPMPPLSAMGLSRFAVFEQGDFNGITYLNRIFHQTGSGDGRGNSLSRIDTCNSVALTWTGRLSEILCKWPGRIRIPVVVAVGPPGQPWHPASEAVTEFPV